MKKSSKRIIIVFFIVLCLVISYKVAMDYLKGEVKTDLADVNTDNQEISLGDNSNCKTYTCSAGTLQNGKCLSGPTGQPQTNCTGSNQTFTNGGCYNIYPQICASCDDGYVLKSGTCGSCSISFGGTSHVSPGEAITVTVGYKGSGCKGATIKYESKTSNGSISLSEDATNEAKSTSFSVTAGSDTCKSEIISITGAVTKTITVSVVNAWTSLGDMILSSALPAGKLYADFGGDDYYSLNCSQLSSGKYKCTHVQGRTCDQFKKSEEEPACYGNAKYISIATVARALFPSEAEDLGYQKIENVTVSSCTIVKDPSYCQPSANCRDNGRIVKENICEDNMTIKYTDGRHCGGRAFYQINCDNEVEVEYDNGDDGSLTETTNTIYVGQGFKFGLTVTTKRKCTGSFNKQNWLNVYNQITNKIRKVNSDINHLTNNYTGSDKTSIETKLKSEKSRLRNVQNAIKSIVTAYNSYDPSTAYNEQASISLNYKVDGKAANVNSDFEVIVLEDGAGEYSSKTEVDLGIESVTNPYNFEWSNEDNLREIKMIIPQAYLDAETGEITNKPGIDGGNKLYVSYNADVGTYNLDINAKNLKCNGAIENKKCRIKLKEKTILYRPIDVSNPFINDDWKIGANWLNNQFDFRNIIKSNIWSNEGCYSKYSNGTWGNC